MYALASAATYAQPFKTKEIAQMWKLRDQFMNTPGEIVSYTKVDRLQGSEKCQIDNFQSYRKALSKNIMSSIFVYTKHFKSMRMS